MGGTDERFGTSLHFVTLHELNLGAVEIVGVFAVNRVLGKVQFPGEHHLARGKEGVWSLENHPGADKKTKRNSEQWNPPAPPEERLVTVQTSDNRRGD